MKLNDFQKKVITATLISFAICLDIFLDLLSSMNFMNMMPFGGTIFKISILPILLIGFNFGFFYGLGSCLLFNLFHLLKAKLILFTFLKDFHFTILDFFIIVIFDYILPDLLLSLSGFFSFQNSQNKKIFFSLFLIFLFILISRLISSYFVWCKQLIIYNYQNGGVLRNFPFLENLLINRNLFFYSFVYNLIPILCTFVLNYIIIFFYYNVLKKNIN